MKTSNFFGKNFFIILIIAVGIYSIFLIYSDFNTVINNSLTFNFVFIPLILLTIFSSWMFLFIRWTVLLKNSNIEIPFKDNLLIYLAGFTFSISPAKTGELIKSIFLKNKFNIDKSTSIPIIFLERFYDVLALIVLILFGISFLGFEFLPIVILCVGMLFSILFLIYSKSKFNYFIRFTSKFKFLQKFITPLENSHEIIRKSITPKTFLISTSLTIFYRLIEALSVYLVFLGFGIDLISYFELTYMYSASIILGSISMIPGGLGVTEGSLASLISSQGIAFSSALVLVIIIRFFTLWFGVIVGFIALKLSGALNVNDN